MYTKEDYIEKGYVFHGYFPPELSTNEEYPDYIKKPTEEKIKKIKSFENENSFSFAFMADTHFAPTHNHHIRLSRALNSYRQIKEKTSVLGLVLGGDLGANGEKKFAINAFEEFIRHFCDIDFFPLIGNHDDNSIWQACIKSEKSEHHLSNNELYELLFSSLEKRDVCFDKSGRKTYYYFDDCESKVRYIVLDISDIPIIMEDGNLKYKCQHTYAYSQKQIDWLVSDALNFNEDGWSVLFFTHNVALKGGEDAPHLEILNKILDVYKNGEDIDKCFDEGDFEINLNAEFSKYKRADIIAVFFGHYHRDIIEKSENGIIYISTSNASMYNHDDHIREDGTFGEILFDVVNIDKDKRIINLIRIGYGEDREVCY